MLGTLEVQVVPFLCPCSGSMPAWPRGCGILPQDHISINKYYIKFGPITSLPSNVGLGYLSRETCITGPSQLMRCVLCRSTY